MIKGVFSILIALSAVFAAGCSRVGGGEPKAVLAALDKAGSNRGELEDVLAHYRDDPEKLEAARWLIGNMPSHYNYEGAEIDSMEAVLANLCGFKVNIVIPDDELDKWRNFSYATMKRNDHVRSISADYLINNIDRAYEQWKTRKWNKNLSLEDFCEYLLPYCIGDERLSDWRKIYADHYAAKLDSVYDGDDAVAAAKALLELVYEDGWRYNDQLSTPHRGGDMIMKHKIGFNRDFIDYLIYSMRACGIPVAVDLVLLTPDGYRSHQWAVVRDNVTGRFIPFGCDEMRPDRVNHPRDLRKKGKVYRTSFARQEEHIKRIDEIKSLPLRIVNPYLKDVSDQYFEPNTITVPVVADSREQIYLGLMSLNEWRPIDHGKHIGDSVVFTNIEPGVFYVPLIVDNKYFEPAGDPFVVERDCSVTNLHADTMCVQKIRIMRTMPYISTVIRRLSNDVIGAVIEADVTPDFSSSDTLYTITDTLFLPNCRFLSRNSVRPYRYVRYSAPEGRWLSVAEFEVFEHNDLTGPIDYKVIDKVKYHQDPMYLHDKNPHTNYTVPVGGGSFTLELERESPIGSIFYIPRNDGRFIERGKTYRLEYLEGKEWKAAGTVTAHNDLNYVEFVVPVNALFRMLDLSDHLFVGSPFIYRNNRQVYSVDFGFFNLRP
ncbi:MAG: hypothetical protein K2I18_01405 [Paramuribaculum sp.]|nr:hypothetical protein [Paramuribaculum sp.]